MSATVRKANRLVSFLCYLGYAWSLLGLIFVFSPQIKRLGAWYPAVFGILIALFFIAYVGVNYMKKWGVHLLMLAFIVDLCLRISIDKVSVADTVVYGISLFAFLFQYNKMDENL